MKLIAMIVSNCLHCTWLFATILHGSSRHETLEKGSGSETETDDLHIPHSHEYHDDLIGEGIPNVLTSLDELSTEWVTFVWNANHVPSLFVIDTFVEFVFDMFCIWIFSSSFFCPEYLSFLDKLSLILKISWWSMYNDNNSYIWKQTKGSF